MTHKEQRFTRMLRSRGIGFILSALAMWGAWSHAPAAVSAAAQSGAGVSSSLTSLLASLLPGWPLESALSLAGIAALAVLMVAVNRQYTLLKTLSVFFAAYFIWISCATPIAAAGCVAPVVLALTVTVCMWLLYSIYGVRACDRRIFLIFCLLSAGAMLVDWSFALYVPLFGVGLAQMKVLRFKKIIAALIGLATPWWIGLGLGAVDEPQLPRIFFTPPDMILTLPGGWPLVAAVGLSLATGLVFGTVTLVRILGFNARARAYNGFLALAGIYTGVLAIVNFTAVASYVVLLNVFVAFQTGHFFRITASRRGYIVMLALLAAYAGVWLWAAA